MELVIDHVSKSFKTKQVIKNITFHMNKGECVGLIGPNGAGKSTVMKMITGILQPDAGSIMIDHKDINNVKDYVGYLPQYPAFFEWMSVEEALTFIGELSPMTRDKLEHRIKDLLRMVGLEGHEKDKVNTLSGGMRQRLGIAQSIIHEPAILILDEPVSALDPIGRREVIRLIQKIKQDTTILLSTHILSDAEEICDRFIILKDGELVADTSKEDIFSSKFQHTIAIEVVEETTPLKQILKRESYIKSVEQQDNRYLVEVCDIDKNKYDLLHAIHKHKVNYKKIEIYKENLETAFLDMVVEK